MNQLHFPRSRSILIQIIKEQRLLWKLICWFWVVEWIKVMKVRSCQKSFLLKVRREQKKLDDFFLSFLSTYLHLLHYSLIHTWAKKSLFGHRDQVGFEWLSFWDKLFHWGLKFALGNSNVEGNFQLHLRSRQAEFGNRVEVVELYLEATCFFFLPSLSRLTRKMLRCAWTLF